ncbi:MAG: hypothetical protein V4760_02130, partial [Bdellovibrionota bacterium]
GAAAPTETTFALDGVKYISTSIGRGDDARTYGQMKYSISKDARVLLRFESLSANQTRILSTQPILIRVFAPDTTEQTNAVANLKACPIVADWMMAATWSSAHPYRGGSWPEGSPISHNECVDAFAPAAATGDCAIANAVCYDVSAWYKGYVIESGRNFGHALVADSTTVVIQGDGSFSKGPRIQWSE